MPGLETLLSIFEGFCNENAGEGNFYDLLSRLAEESHHALWIRTNTRISHTNETVAKCFDPFNKLLM